MNETLNKVILEREKAMPLAKCSEIKVKMNWGHQKINVFPSRFIRNLSCSSPTRFQPVFFLFPRKRFIIDTREIMTLLENVGNLRRRSVKLSR